MKTEPFSLASATDTVVFDTLVRVIRYDEGSGTGTPTIRVKSLSGGAFDVEMKPGKVLKLPETVRGIVITNLTANPITGKLTIGAGDIVDNNLSGTVALDAAALAALESVDLNSATITSLRQPLLPGSNWSDNSTLIAGNPVAVFAAAANPNGAIIWSMHATDVAASVAPLQTFVAKATAPVSILDGLVIAQSVITARSDGASLTWSKIEREVPTRIPAGLGFFFISGAAGGTGYVRSCRYTLL